MQHLKTVLTLARSAILPTVRTRRRAVYRKLIERYLHLLSRNIDYLGVGKRQGAVSRVGGSQQSLVISHYSSVISHQSTVNSEQSTITDGATGIDITYSLPMFP
jgi:hypothetical protein